jgi:hypothetical protein
MSINPKFIMDVEGEQTGVVLTMEEFKELIEAYEDLEDLKAYDAAKAEPDEYISWEDAKKELKLANKI